MDYEQKYKESMNTYNYDTTSKMLKPCPFCGGQVVWHHTGNANTHNYKVIIECMSCNIKMQIAGKIKPLEWLEKKIIEKWNKRMER